jgi:hypothetical protein
MPVNKMMVFPLGVMIVVSLFAVVYSGLTYSDTLPEQTNFGNITFNDTSSDQTATGGTDTGIVSIDFWTVFTAIIILGGSIAIGIASGIAAFGFHLSERAQSLIFNSSLFLGLWVSLSVIILDIIFGSTVLMIGYIGLSIMYMVGLGMGLGEVDN